MAGILELLIRPQKMAMHDRKAMELQTAKEILAEVFSVRISEVDEMIANRFSDCPGCQKETWLWPQEFRLGE
jgi:hypothetical protein